MASPGADAINGDKKALAGDGDSPTPASSYVANVADESY
jgi:hypothetical protein